MDRASRKKAPASFTAIRKRKRNRQSCLPARIPDRPVFMNMLEDYVRDPSSFVSSYKSRPIQPGRSSQGLANRILSRAQDVSLRDACRRRRYTRRIIAGINIDSRFQRAAVMIFSQSLIKRKRNREKRERENVPCGIGRRKFI